MQKYQKYFLYFVISMLLVYIFILRNNIDKDKKHFNKRLELIKKLETLRNENKIKNDFDKIPKYYINLDISKDRNDIMKKEIVKYNVKNIERFPGINGKLLKNVNKGQVNGYTYQVKNSITFSQLGCALSHLLLIKKIHDLNLDYALILEDDMQFSLAPYWEKSIQELVNQTPKNWELLYLTYSNYNSQFKEKTSIKHITRDINGTCAYLISKKGCQKILNTFFKNNKIILNVKKPVIDVDVFNKLNRFLVTPSYFINQNPTQTSTVDDRGVTKVGLENSLNTSNYYLKKKELQNEV